MIPSMLAPSSSFAFQFINPGYYLVVFTRKHMSRSRFSEQGPPVSHFEAALSESVTFATVALMIRSGSGSVGPSHFVRGLYEYVKVKYLIVFRVSAVLSLSLGFTLESGFLQACSCLLWPVYHQNYFFRSTPPPAFLYAGLRTVGRHFLISICCVGISWALLGGDYCQPKDLVLCGNEERKTRSPTLRIGIHFAELIMLIHDLLSKNLVRPICQTVLVTPNSEASCPHPLRSCS
jgi:hypothetical protein